MIPARQLASRLGLRWLGREARGNCPLCGYVGAFVIGEARNGAALLWCASCQDSATLARTLLTGEARPFPAPKPERDQRREEYRRRRLLAVWHDAGAVAGTVAERYLARRGLGCLVTSPALRFGARVQHPDGSQHPALVAAVRDVAGELVAVHRTYLTPDGFKIPGPCARASLGPVMGAAIRLYDLTPDKPLVIGEGIESSASAGLLMGWPAWAALSAGNLARAVVLPSEARRVCIATDPDLPGREASRAAWMRLRAGGRDVTIASPTGPGDFNDRLLAMGGCHE